MNNIRTILQCPNCAAVLAFEYASSNIKECTCGVVVKRMGDQLTVYNSLNKVTVKGYQLKPGTTGEWTGKLFSVLGKMGVWFEESFFSYWFIVFNDGQTGFIAEGYGLWSILLEEKNAGIKDSDLANNKIGQVIADKGYQLQKKNSTYYWEVEGELYLKNCTAYFDVYEYAGEAGQLFTLFKWGDRNLDTYNNHPCTPDDLKLKNIQATNCYGFLLKCAECAKEIKLRTYPLAHSCTCTECGTYNSIEKKQTVKKGKNKNNLFEPLLKIGAKGILKDIEYEVVGYMQKEEQNKYRSKWREYVLFNPAYGFVFLSEFEGHWIYIKETIAAPVILNENIKAFELDKESFYLYNSYSYDVLHAGGEFPYNAFDNNNTQVKEYISPPEIWIREKNSKEGITWFFGEHISGSEIKRAFSLGGMPYRTGIGAVQPTGYISIEKLLLITLIGIAGLLLLHLLFISNKENRVITQGTYLFADSTDKTAVVTEKFTLDKWRSNLAFDISGSVNNSWFELSAVLVNVETGKEYTMEQGIEYYFGYTDGENWTEGERSGTAHITNIPAGKYFLQLEGTRENNSLNKLNDFSVKVIYDEASYRNFWFAVLLLLIWPGISFFWNQYSEKNRWEGSPYSNYYED